MPSCQFSLYPLGTKDLSPAIDSSLEELQKLGIEYEMGNMSTVAYGSCEEIFLALKNIFDLVSRQPVVMAITISNACPIPQKRSD